MDATRALLIASLSFLGIGGLLPLFTPRSRSFARFAYLLCFAAGLALVAFSVKMLTSPVALQFELPFGFTSLERPRFFIDALSAFFCLILGLLSTTISLFSIRYAYSYIDELPGILAGFFNFVVLSMLLVFISDNAFQFLIGWEAMTLFAFFLVAYEYKKEQSIRAAGYYIVMTHFGTLFLISMFLVISHYSGSPNLSEAARLASHFPKGALNFIFIAALIGFGTKAGLFPVHIWLPLAHPVAPTNVSALMSGMLIKTGIYGLLRILLILNHSIETWWAIALLVVASVSALLGVMYALMEHDLKRLLAYHSIENIGIILIGVAMAMLFWHFQMPTLAGFALTAGLFHTLNHALFKALLFLGAGNLHYSLHTRDLEKMGGLIKVMPWTAGAFLIGAMSISAIPPFNGFVSEWMTFVSIVQIYVIEKAPEVIRISVSLSGAMLALTGALAAACFVKVFGIAFLGTPRTDGAAQAREAPSSMWIPQLVLAFLCVALGIFPFLIIKATAGIRSAFFGIDAGASVPVATDFLSAPGNVGSISTFYVLGSLLFFSFFGWAIARSFGGGKQTLDITWGCGGVVGGRQQYTATGFSKPVRIIFSALYQPKKQIVIDTGENRYHIKSIKYHGEIQNIFERFLYVPAVRLAEQVSSRLLTLQDTSINAYLGYILVLFILLLLLGGRL